MGFVSLSDARKRAEEVSSTLSCFDFPVDSLVYVLSEDGSVLVFRSAFCLQYKGWYLVFTEHHGNHVYEKEDATVLYFENASNIAKA